MATGIVSVGLQLTGHETLSRIALVIGCTIWWRWPPISPYDCRGSARDGSRTPGRRAP